MTTSVGAGVWRKFGAEFVLCFSSGWNVPTDVFADFLHADFCVDLCPLFGQIFGAQTFARIFSLQRLLRRFSADFLQMYWSLKIGVLASRTNAHKIRIKVSGFPMTLPNWVPYSISVS